MKKQAKRSLNIKTMKRLAFHRACALVIEDALPCLDRVGILHWLLAVAKLPVRRNAPPYHVAWETEIARIAKLEPLTRAYAATQLLERWKDAERVRMTVQSAMPTKDKALAQMVMERRYAMLPLTMPAEGDYPLMLDPVLVSDVTTDNKGRTIVTVKRSFVVSEKEAEVRQQLGSVFADSQSTAALIRNVNSL